MLKVILLICSFNIFAFELTLIHGVSRTNQTFITRNGKKDGIFKGKKSTFTADNVSIIARAIEVTRDFTQWEIMNDFTDVPFRKGQTVTFYDAKEYLWTLNPELIKAKYIKSYVFKPKVSVSFNSSIVTGLSETVSGVDDTNSQRSGLSIESYFERMLSKTYALGIGIRYTKENIVLTSASLETQRLLGILEAKYYFGAIEELSGARFSLGLGLGIGESVTSTTGAISTGVATLLPSTKLTLNYPMNDTTDFLIETGYESLTIKEEFQNGNEQVTTLDNFKFGLGIKRFF